MFAEHATVIRDRRRCALVALQSSSMARLAFVLIGVVVVVRPTNTVRCLAGSCEQHCPDDDDRGQCPPGCAGCSSCANPAPFVSELPLIAPLCPSAQRAILPSSEKLPGSADPRELLHVPKLHS